MTHSRFFPSLLFGLLALIALLLSAAFIVAERPLGVGVVWLLAGIWAALLWRNGRGAATWPALLLVLTAAAAPVNAPQAVVWSYLGVLGALLLWDLSRFRRRLHDVAAETVQPLIAAHLNRLGLLAALALLALAAQQWLPLAFNFDWALLSGLGLMLGLGYLLRRLKEENE